MNNSRIKQIYAHGQSIWLDFIDRKIMSGGKLQALIDEDGIRGITSNPTIFEKAFSASSDYDQDIHDHTTDQSDEELFFEIAVKDIRQAADVFLPVYDEKNVGTDGFVSLEVSPRLAMEAEPTIRQAINLWAKLDRKNVMIKIPATLPGLSAIRNVISEGINVNVTLLFSLERYHAVTEAYIAGLEDRQEAGEDISTVSSVASFFLSRIDSMVDPILDAQGLSQFRGQVAIACAKLAYNLYKIQFSGPRWEVLAEKGAVPQRLLWASTGNKNPDFKDTVYLEALIGPNTVNTVPMDTLNAFRDHGIVSSRLEENLNQAQDLMQTLEAHGIDLTLISAELEADGLKKFNAPFDALMTAIESKRKEFSARKT